MSKKVEFCESMEKTLGKERLLTDRKLRVFLNIWTGDGEEYVEGEAIYTHVEIYRDDLIYDAYYGEKMYGDDDENMQALEEDRNDLKMYLLSKYPDLKIRCRHKEL